MLSWIQTLNVIYCSWDHATFSQVSRTRTSENCGRVKTATGNMSVKAFKRTRKPFGFDGSDKIAVIWHNTEWSVTQSGPRLVYWAPIEKHYVIIIALLSDAGRFKRAEAVKLLHKLFLKTWALTCPLKVLFSAVTKGANRRVLHLAAPASSWETSSSDTSAASVWHYNRNIIISECKWSFHYVVRGRDRK